MTDLPELLPAAPLDLTGRRQLVIQFWTDLEMSGDAGGTTWEVLDGLRDRVTACLAVRPPGIEHAERLTAQAMLLLQGLSDC